MIELGDKDISVYLCNFEITVQNANILIKFPCHYFIQWKSINGKILAYSKKYPSLNNSCIQFNQTLNIQTEMLYDNTQKTFYKKDSLLLINLVSKSRPDQIKLVGRVNIDLAQMCNHNICMYTQMATYQLTYCSVKADITFSARIIAKQWTDKQPFNLDKSSFNDFFIFNQAITNPDPLKVLQRYSSNIQNVTFPTFKLKQQRINEESQKNQKQQRNTNNQIHKLTNFVTNQRTQQNSFRTVPPKKQFTYKSTNDSLEHHNGWTVKQQKFSDQIDYNKRKINDLQIKISDLCRSLEQSKNLIQRKDCQNKQKQEMISKLKQKQNTIIQQYENLKKLKRSQSSAGIEFEQDNIQIYEVQKPIKNYIPSNVYNQKISQSLQMQRLLQENQYVIRELETTKAELQKKLMNQKNQSDQIQSIWRQKREHYEQKIKNLQKQKRDLNFEVQNLIKYKFKVEEATEQKNRIKQQYKELEHELMKSRYQLNDKIQKHAQSIQKLHSKQSQIQRIRRQNKQMVYLKNNIERQITEMTITNEKLQDALKLKQSQILKMNQRNKQAQNKIINLSGQLAQNKRVEEENRKMQQKLTTYNSYMQTLQNTIKNLQNQIQACQYISRINENLKNQLSKFQSTIRQKQQIIAQKDMMIGQKQQQIMKCQQQTSLMHHQKQQLLDKNQSFQQQIQKIQHILQESFYRKQKQNQQTVARLKQQIRISTDQYQKVIKQKSQLQDQIQNLIQQKQEHISQLQKDLNNLQFRVQDLLKTISDKLNIITMKDIELQNRKLISQQLTRKHQQMQQKQKQMQQTIKILQEQSKKIFDIIEEKQFIDNELIQLRKSTEEHLYIIEELQETIMQIKMEKQQITRKYLEEIQVNQELKETIKRNDLNGLKYVEQINFFRSKTQETQLIIQQLTKKIQSLIQEINNKHLQIGNLQQKNQTLLRNKTKLQSIIQNNKNLPSKQQPLLQNRLNNYEQIVGQKQKQLKPQVIISQNNLQKYQNQILQLKGQKKTLSQKIFELEEIINQSNSIHQFTKQQYAYPYNANQRILQDINRTDRSQQITPVKNILNQEFPIQSAQKNYILSDRKHQISNRSNQSVGSMEYIQSPKVIEQQNSIPQNQYIPELKFKEFNQFKKEQNKINKSQVNKNVPKQQNNYQQLNFKNIGVQLTNQESQIPQLKIQKLFNILQLKNNQIEDLEQQQQQLKNIIAQLTIKNNQTNRTPSPKAKIVKNQPTQPNQTQKLKKQTQNKMLQIKKLKKNIRLMNLELVALRNLKKQKIIGGIQIRMNKSQSQTHSHQNITQFSETNYFNLTNAVNPNQKSYIIRKKMNEQESMNDSKRSPKKLSKYGQILSNRNVLQKKFNVNSRVSLNSNILVQTDKQNKFGGFSSIEQRVIDKLQNTAHFSTLQQENNQFVTTITDLKHKINQLQQALVIIEQEKIFLQNQIQLFEQQKFCLSSDLNARQIEIYQLYKSIISMRQQISMLKYQNEAYLKMIEDHETNVNSLVKKAQQNCSKIRPSQKQIQKMEKFGSISVSNISYQPQELKSQIDSIYLMKQSVQDQALNRDDQRLSMIQKIQRYEKKVEQSLIIEKQKQILEQQIQSKQEILIDQNQKIYEQQSQIHQLYNKISSLEEQIKSLSEMLRVKDSQQTTKNNNRSHQYMITQNQFLVKENQNLKQEIQFLGDQIDRMNGDFNKLNCLLFKRQEQISLQKNIIVEISQKQIINQQHITSLQNQLTCLGQQLKNISANDIFLKQITQKVQDLNQQFSNLKTNIQNEVFTRKQSIQHQSSDQFIFALMESMKNNFNQTINVLKTSKQQ